jgi:hypothetical protein
MRFKFRANVLEALEDRVVLSVSAGPLQAAAAANPVAAQTSLIGHSAPPDAQSISAQAVVDHQAVHTLTRRGSRHHHTGSTGSHTGTTPHPSPHPNPYPYPYPYTVMY